MELCGHLAVWSRPSGAGWSRGPRALRQCYELPVNLSPKSPQAAQLDFQFIALAALGARREGAVAIIEVSDTGPRRAGAGARASFRGVPDRVAQRRIRPGARHRT